MEAIIAAIVNTVVGNLAEKGLEAYKAHINGQISHEQLMVTLKSNAMQAATSWWQNSNDATVKTFDSFQQTMRVTKTARVVWAYFMVTQITFIVWLQVGVPFVTWYFDIRYPGVGSLDEWAMAAVLACLGLGPIVLKHAQPQVPKVDLR